MERNKEILEDCTDEDEEGQEWEHWREDVGNVRQTIRLDQFAAMRLARWTRSRAKRACLRGALRVDGEVKKASYRVKPGDRVTLILPHPKPGPMQAEAIPLEVLYEDGSLIVINKPAGLVCHPGPGHRQGTLLHGLLWHFQGRPATRQEREFGDLPGLVHRLDRETSGVMVIAKTTEVAVEMWPQFAQHTIEREYDAFVWGDVSFSTLRIDAPIGRSLRDPLKHAIVEKEKGGKEARTLVRLIQKGRGWAWLRCSLETGRTHQIRLHLGSIGHPLIGEGLYLPPEERAVFLQGLELSEAPILQELSRHALHARVLGFSHPKTGEWKRFEADLPADLRAFVDALEHGRKDRGEPF